MEISSWSLTKSIFGKFLQSVHACLLKEDILSAVCLRMKVGIVNILHKEIQESRFEGGRIVLCSKPLK